MTFYGTGSIFNACGKYLLQQMKKGQKKKKEKTEYFLVNEEKVTS